MRNIPQNKHVNKLKLLLAEKRISIKVFFEDYYQKYSKKSYKEFLEDLNTFDVYTYSIKCAHESLKKSLGIKNNEKAI